MKCEWKEIPFGELLEIPLRNGVSKPKSVRGNGYKMVNMGELFSNSRIYYIEMDRAPLTEKEKETSLVEVGDLLFARQSLVFSGAGKCSIVKEVCEPTTYESHLIRARINRNLASPDYMYYYFSSPQGRGRIQSIVEQVSAAGIRGSDLSKLSVRVPPLEVQKKIADILCCIDDKVEFNNKINANLQQQAQAIFKSWFVDFEPFQDGEFVESELGPIPKGWKVGTISDLGTVVGGATPSKSKPEYYTSNGIGWITPKDLAVNKNLFVSHGAIDITQEGLNNSSARIMPKGTVLFSSRAPIGYMAIANDEVTTNQGFKSVVPHENVGTAYVYYFLKYNLPMIDSLGSGSTFKEVSGATMKSVLALVPDDNTLRKFANVCDSVFQKQECLERENGALINMRDALLPKMMNGEIEAIP